MRGLPFVHVVTPDEVLTPRRGLFIERTDRIEALHLILHVTLGKPREFPADYRMRMVTARPMHWIALRWYRCYEPGHRLGHVTLDRGTNHNPATITAERRIR